MKKRCFSFWFVSVLLFSSAIVVCAEKDRPLAKIEDLQKQMQIKREAYQLALRNTVSEAEKNRLTDTYIKSMAQLDQQIEQHEQIMSGRTSITNKWLWNAAAAVGVVALAGLAAYNFLTTAPIIPLTNSQPPSTGDIGTSTLGMFSAVDNSVTIDKELVSSLLSQKPKQLQLSSRSHLTKEQYEKYKNASNAYGAVTVWFSIVAFILKDTFFVPYAVVTGLGSMYYGAKMLDLKPVDWRNLSIPTQEMPY
jgi:hypothetical protein